MFNYTISRRCIKLHLNYEKGVFFLVRTFISLMYKRYYEIYLGILFDTIF